MPETTTTPNTLTLDGVQYEVSRFSSTVQQAVAVYNKFAAQLQDQQLEVAKTQAALAFFSSQIATTVKQELESEKSVEDAPQE